jgi:hypothetical protein
MAWSLRFSQRRRQALPFTLLSRCAAGETALDAAPCGGAPSSRIAAPGRLRTTLCRQVGMTIPANVSDARRQYRKLQGKLMA